MVNLEELKILILEIIGKHSNINNDYSLTRFFAKSSILPDKLYKTLKDLVADGYITIIDVKYTVKTYQLTMKGQIILDTTHIHEYLHSFTLLIDPTGFISKIVFLLENKGNIADVVDSFLLSDGSLIVFLNSSQGKLCESTILENEQKKKWKIKEYTHVMGSIDTYEKIKRED